MSEFPELRAGQVCVARAEVDTGCILGHDGKRHLGAGIPYRVFDSLDEARDHARAATATTPNVECVLLRSPHDVIEVHRSETYVSGSLDKERSQERRWWQFWR